MVDPFSPGFRFYPTEEELVSFYLRQKLDRTCPELNRVVSTVDIYAVEPWDLPKMAGERCSGETEQWFFFMPRQEREAHGGKPNRTTMSGYWKATGSMGYVYSTSEKKVIGVKRTMIFHRGRAHTGRKTKWKMNEYKFIDTTPQNVPSSSANACCAAIPKVRQEMSLCRVYITSGSSRAFDRRPSTITEAAPPALTPPSRAPLVPENTRSMSISGSPNSGGDDGYGHQTKEVESSSNFDHDEITNGLEPLWEWEQLDWP